MLNFKDYIHNLRKTTIEQIKPYLKNKYIRIGLEVGAGDGFQSRLLVEYLDELIVTEYSKDRLQQIHNEKIKYYIADAENLESSIDLKEIDIIFSSHLLEHLPNPEKLLQSCTILSSKKGVIIHVVPSNWYAFFRLVFYYPSLIVRIFKKMRNNPRDINLFEKTETIIHNNLKIKHKPKIKLFTFLFPKPHGISNNLLQEYLSMCKTNWSKLFIKNNLEIVDIINGSCFSGYGFGFKRTKNILSKIGFASEYIYILKKKSDD